MTRVEEVFRLHGHEAKGVNCPVIDGLVEEAEEIMSDADDPEVLDAALLSAAQAVEHYEITRYGTLAAWAKQLGRPDCARILHGILEEEKRTDEKLTQLAEVEGEPQGRLIARQEHGFRPRRTSAGALLLVASGTVHS